MYRKRRQQLDHNITAITELVEKAISQKKLLCIFKGNHGFSNCLEHDTSNVSE